MNTAIGKIQESGVEGYLHFKFCEVLPNNPIKSLHQLALPQQHMIMSTTLHLQCFKIFEISFQLHLFSAFCVLQTLHQAQRFGMQSVQPKKDLLVNYYSLGTKSSYPFKNGNCKLVRYLVSFQLNGNLLVSFKIRTKTTEMVKEVSWAAGRRMLHLWVCGLRRAPLSRNKHVFSLNSLEET